MARYADCLGYKTEFVLVKEKVRKYVFEKVHYVYLNGIFVGIVRNCPPGSIFWAITPNGQYVIRHPTMVGCVRRYIMDCLLIDSTTDRAPGGDE